MTGYRVGWKLDRHVVRPQPRVETCQHWFVQDGALYQCGLPTKGRTYCADCSHELQTGPSGRRYTNGTGPAFAAPSGQKIIA